MDRRRPGAGARRNRSFTIRVTEAERAEIVAVAETTGFTPGAFVTLTALAVARGEIPLGATPRDVLEALLNATVPVVRSAAALERVVAEAAAAGRPTAGLESIAAECRRTLHGLDEAARTARRRIR